MQDRFLGGIMYRGVRAVLVVGGLILLVLAAGYAFQMPWAMSTWFWTDTRLSLIFIASILAAIAAAMLWIGVSGDFGSLAAGALNILVMMGGLAGFIVPLAQQQGDTRLLAFGVACAVFAVFNVALFLWAHRQPVRATTPTPRPVRWSFIVYTVMLVLAGVALILRIPNVMPWPPRVETGVVIGMIFLGDAFYFLYALLRPFWSCARAQLWSFLAYDIVLLPPLLALWPTVRPELRNSLLVYLVVLIYSAALSIFYLLLNPATRVWSQPTPPPVRRTAR